ncbi:MAG: hypothetical protein HC844_03310 [Tabrizicola sp.]|nr:hypothetical protein [Tabrizicola sp.]
MKRRVGHSLALAGALLAGSEVTIAFAQEEDRGGTTLTFGLASTVNISDNFNLEVDAPGTSTILDNEFTFGLLSETRTERLSFDLGAVLRFADIPGAGSDISVDDPSAAFAYSRDWANSRLSLSADYNQADLDFLDPFELVDDFDDIDLVTDTGTRKTSAARLTFETGLNDPFGVELDLQHDDVDYVDTTDPELFDNRTDEASLTGKFRFSPVLEGRVTAALENYTADDAIDTDRTSTRLSFGATYEVSPVLTVDAELGTEKIDEDSLGTSDRGTFGAVEVTQTLANGTAGLLLERTFGIEGGRTSLSVSRDMELPGGTLGFSLGATRGELGSTELLAGLDYSRALPRGTVTAELDRSVVSNDAGNDVLTTRAALGLDLNLAPLSTVSFGLDYAETEDAGAGTTSRSDRTGLRAEYSHELTPDWDLTTGYEHTRLFTEGTGTATSNTVFLTLERVFTLRP